MPPKKTNIKIKRSKFNLYNKKRSKAKRALTILVTIVAVCGLGILGYGLGKPLLEYIQNKGKDVEGETSSLISSIMESAIVQTSDESSESNAGVMTVSTDETSAPESDSEPEPITAQKMYFLPDTAALDEVSLDSALADAKSSGCEIVAVTLKDTIGHLLYKTAIEEVKDTDTVSGTLTAAQIAAKISEEGFTPAVRINTLLDQLGAVYAKANYRISDSAGGGTWHDNTEEKGGKAWMSPFKQEAAQYIGNIADELSKAGFKHIICVNTRFPSFFNVDVTKYLVDLPLKDNAKRIAALWSIVTAADTAAEKNGADVWVEISGANLIAEQKNGTDAELVADAEKLKGVGIVVNYDVTAANLSTDNSGTLDDYNAAKSFIQKAKTALGGAEFSVKLPQSLTGSALEDVKKALDEAQINYS